MKHREAIEKDVCEMLSAFSGVGALPGGGVTRLSYSPAEDEMHAIFRNQAARAGFRVWTDAVGNSFAANFPDSDTPYTLIGSHLDSVVEGGEYDGVAGVIAGLAVLRELRASGNEIPVAVAAFRCEESVNYKICTVGSGLITHTAPIEDLRRAVGIDGVPFAQSLSRRGLTMDAPRITGVKRYLELHIEQGRVLVNAGADIGVVTAIAAPHRYMLKLVGMAEHSGATPMSLRRDALCAAAEVVLQVEALGRAESEFHSVATVGEIKSHPNVINVVPGEVGLQIDLRCIDTASMTRMERALEDGVQRICAARRIDCSLRKEESKLPAPLDRTVIEQLFTAAEDCGFETLRLPSGAGHDALSFVPLCPTGMVFIPCRDGISHNIHEYAKTEHIANGVLVLKQYLLHADGE